MPALMTDDELRRTALAALEGQLGPVETLRFVAMVRREPFDYQAWRDKHFAGLSVDELFRQMQDAERGASPP